VIATTNDNTTEDIMANKVELIKTCRAVNSEMECSDIVTKFQTEEVVDVLDSYECKVTIEKDGSDNIYKAICKGTMKKQKAPVADPKPAAK
jgi:hypothetical protein